MCAAGNAANEHTNRQQNVPNEGNSPFDGPPVLAPGWGNRVVDIPRLRKQTFL